MKSKIEQILSRVDIKYVGEGEVCIEHLENVLFYNIKEGILTFFYKTDRSRDAADKTFAIPSSRLISIDETITDRSVIEDEFDLANEIKKPFEPLN